MNDDIVISVLNLSKHYSLKKTEQGAANFIAALNDVSFDVKKVKVWR